MTSQIAQKYASAYFSVAKEEKILKEASNNLKMLAKIILNSEKIFNTVNSPISSKSQRFLFINKLASLCKLHTITKNLLCLLAEYRCINLLREIINYYNSLYLDFKKEIEIEVISTKKITQNDLASIKNFFEKKLVKQVYLKNNLDKTIMGGIIIKFGSFVLDGSIANKIKDIKFTLRESIQEGF